MMQGLLRPVLILAVVLAFGPAGCAKQEPTDKPTEPPPAAVPATPAASVAVRTESVVWNLARDLTAQSLPAAADLRTAVENLLGSPDLEKLTAAQRQWRAAAAQVEQLHVFSRLGAVAPQHFFQLQELQFALSAWPIQPGYLDGFGEHPYSGIVFDVGVPLTAEVLREQHGMTDSGDATLGLYAMEFLLFGEDNNRGPLVFQPITALDDQHRADGYGEVAELPRNRRRELLRLQATILADDLARLQALWADPQPERARYHFEILPLERQLELWQKAALALVTEQLVTLANLQDQSPGPNNLWQSQQLALRLAAQLGGLRALNQAVPLGADVDNTIDRCLGALTSVANLPPLGDKGVPPRVNWQEAYTALRDLVRALNPGEQPENRAL